MTDCMPPALPRGRRCFWIRHSGHPGTLPGMHYVLIALAIGAGMAIPIQAGFNREFAQHAGHPLFGAVTNFIVGLSVLVLITLGFILTKQAKLPALSALGDAPRWAWLGGFCGALMVLTAVLAVRPLGAAGLIACFVTGQLISSVIVDHYGWLNIPRTPITPLRFIGVVLLLGGLGLILGAPREKPGIEDVAPVAGD